MRFSIISALALPLFGGLVAADCCKKGITYCGKGLLNKGKHLWATPLGDPNHC
jgi:hypothetical protein